MNKKWSKNWIASKQPRKQRKYRANAPLNIIRKLLSAHLVKELRKEHKKRSFPLRKGDKIKVLRGEFKGTIGEVEKVDYKKKKLYVKGVEKKKKDGTSQTKIPIDPSNTTILSLSLTDKKRRAALGRK
jgi:large subunit ribosomal protein L24